MIGKLSSKPHLDVTWKRKYCKAKFLTSEVCKTQDARILSESSRHNLCEAQTEKARREGKVFQYFLSSLQFEQRASFLQEISKPILFASEAWLVKVLTTFLPHQFLSNSFRECNKCDKLLWGYLRGRNYYLP